MTGIDAEQLLRSPPRPVGGRSSARPAAADLARWRHWLSETVGVREEKGRKRPKADTKKLLKSAVWFSEIFH